MFKLLGSHLRMLNKAGDSGKSGSEDRIMNDQQKEASKRSAPDSGQILRSFGTDLVLGLSEKQEESNRAKFGVNEVLERKESPALRLARKFWGLTAWMLELVMVFSLILRNFSDFYIIGGLIVVNVLVGFAQEEKASSAVEALRSKLQIYARVLRSGKWRNIPSKEIVPGDIVRIRAGDFSCRPSGDRKSATQY